MWVQYLSNYILGIAWYTDIKIGHYNCYQPMITLNHQAVMDGIVDRVTGARASEAK